MGTLPVMIAYFLLMNLLGYVNVSSVATVLTVIALGADLLLTLTGIRKGSPGVVPVVIASEPTHHNGAGVWVLQPPEGSCCSSECEPPGPR